MTTITISDAGGVTRFAASYATPPPIPQPGHGLRIGDFAGVVASVHHAYDERGHQAITVRCASFIGDQDDDQPLAEQRPKQGGEGGTVQGDGVSPPPTFFLSKRPARRGRVRP